MRPKICPDVPQQAPMRPKTLQILKRQKVNKMFLHTYQVTCIDVNLPFFLQKHRQIKKRQKNNKMDFKHI